MTKSPLDFKANSTITVKVYAEEPSIDPTTGQIDLGSSTVVPLRALLTPKSSGSIRQPDKGVDASLVFVEGWLTDPLDFPAGLRLPTQVDATIDGRVGTLNLDLKPRSPWGDEQIIGRAISGQFKTVGAS